MVEAGVEGVQRALLQGQHLELLAAQLPRDEVLGEPAEAQPLQDGLLLRREAVEVHRGALLQLPGAQVQPRVGAAHREQQVLGEVRLAQGGAAPSRERMVAVGDEPGPQVRQVDGHEAPGARRQQGHHQLCALALEGLLHAGEELRRDVEAGVGAARAQHAHRAQQRLGRIDAVEDHPQRGLPAGLQLRAGHQQPLLRGEQPAAVREHPLSLMGQAGAVAAPVEQGEARLPLQRLHGVEHRRVSLVQRLRGGHEGAVAGERVQGAGLVEADVHGKDCARGAQSLTKYCAFPSWPCSRYVGYTDPCAVQARKPQRKASHGNQARVHELHRGPHDAAAAPEALQRGLRRVPHHLRDHARGPALREAAAGQGGRQGGLHDLRAAHGAVDPFRRRRTPSTPSSPWCSPRSPRVSSPTCATCWTATSPWRTGSTSRCAPRTSSRSTSTRPSAACSSSRPS